MGVSEADRPMPATLFVALNLGAGALHYLYQVIASRALDKVAFSDFSFWLANVSVGLIAAAVAQYLGNFLPSSNQRLRSIAAALGVAVAMLAVLPWLGENIPAGEMSALTLLFATIHGWLLGQAQNRLLFYTLSAATLFVVLLKLGFVFAPFWPGPPEHRFYWAISFSYVPSIFFLSLRLGVSRQPPSSALTSGAVGAALISPLLLAFASAAFPQIDLIVVKATQDAQVFQDFARASLFYKAVFFIFLILGHWLLPQQIRRRPGLPGFSNGLLFVAGVAVSTVLGLLAPAVSSYVMRWAEAPPIGMIFLSCWNMCLLSWIFLLIQEDCTQSRIRRAGALLAGMIVVYVGVWMLAPPLTFYFAVTIAAALTMIVIHQYK